MITIEQYFGAKPHSTKQALAATDLLRLVNMLCDEAEADGVERQTDPDTGTEISGSKGGNGDGGFRMPGATTGRAMSSHKEGRGVDVFDPVNKLDDWLDLFEGSEGQNSKLEQCGLYRERPNETPGWSHLTTRAPSSGKRTFIP